MVNPVSKENITLDHILAAEFIQKAFRRFLEFRCGMADTTHTVLLCEMLLIQSCSILLYYCGLTAIQKTDPVS